MASFGHGFHVSFFFPGNIFFLSFPSASFSTAMSVNAANGTRPHDLPQLNQMLICYMMKSGIIITTVLTVAQILFLLPIYIYVLYLGFKRWRQQSAGTAVNHSDFLTYHAFLVELISVSGLILIRCGIHAKHTNLATVGIGLTAIQFGGQLLFQILTCGERYLAVVHPVTYMRLKDARGIRIRNFIVGCSWLLCFSTTGLMYIKGQVANLTVYFTLLGSGLVVVSFFSFSVLHILIRPRPAEVDKKRRQVDQQKIRAFKIMMAILTALVLKFASNIVSTATYTSILDFSTQCDLWMGTRWADFPSTLVIPLLYVQRQRKAQSGNNEK